MSTEDKQSLEEIKRQIGQVLTKADEFYILHLDDEPEILEIFSEFIPKSEFEPLTIIILFLSPIFKAFLSLI